MKNEIIKQAFKLGNSAGVILPIEWKGRKVAIKLIDKSVSLELLEILEEENLLKNIIGVFLAGSYARGEETEDSDIDIIAITDNINKQIKAGKYEILFISQDKFEKFIIKSLYLTSLINEARAILNANLLEHYKKKIKNLFINKHLDEIKSITKINEGVVNLDEELGEKVEDETLYSIILRLRELCLIECLKNGKNPTNQDFIDLIKRAATEEDYMAYLRIKNDLKPKKIISVKEAKALIEEIKKKLENLKYGKKKE